MKTITIENKLTENRMSIPVETKLSYFYSLLAALLVFLIPISTTLTQVIMGMIVLTWVFSVSWKEKLNCFFSQSIPLTASLLFLIFLLGISYVDVPLSDSGKMLFKMSKLLYIPILLPFFKEAKTRKIGIGIFIVSMSITLFLGYLKMMEVLPNQSRFTQACVFKNHIDTSLLMTLACFFLGQILIQTKKRLYQAGILALILLMTFYVLVLCEGRSGHIIFFACGILLCLQRLSFKHSLVGMLILGCLLVGLSFTPSRFNLRMQTLIENLQSYTETGDTVSSGAQRVEYFLNSLQIAKEHLWLGVGTGGFKQHYEEYAQSRDLRITANPHNEYLNILVQWGLLGLSAFLLFCFSVLKTSFSLPKFQRYSLQGVLLALILGCLGNSWIMDFTSGYFLVTFIALFTAGLFHSSYTKNRFSPYRFSLLDIFSHSPTTSRPTISVIITTYNWPSALNLVMQALSKQTVLPFEILIADDGSTQETKELIDQIKTQFPIPIHHIWQPDEGFRASAIRNKALAKASGGYIVFMDGDCIPRDNFIEMHGKLAEPGFFVAGNRSLLTQNFTAKLLTQTATAQTPAHASQTFNASMLSTWSLFQCFLIRLQGHCNRFLPFLTLPGQRWRKRNPTQWEGAKGCNLGIWKMDLIRINGWEERFSGWGFEDSDLIIRLIRIGIRRKDGRFALPVIHLWHSENDRSRQTENWNLLRATQHKQRWVAEQGLYEMRTAHGT